MRQLLETRIAELKTSEKEAWAQLNFILGRLEEATMLRDALTEGAMQDGPEETAEEATEDTTEGTDA